VFAKESSSIARLAALLVLAGLWPARAGADAAGPEFFENKIRPVLVEQCYECHSATSGKSKGGLQADSRANLLAGGDNGPALVPGKPAESRLYAALTHEDPDLAMPAKRPKLPDAVIADFHRWITDGAPWPGDANPAPASPSRPVFDLAERKRRLPWIWEPPRDQQAPGVKNEGWPATREDRFILAKLEAQGLAPAPPASPQVWLRRAHFAITGLPPTPEDLHSFLADTSAAARDKVVESLLASPHFGERWARHWMDLVRYAESRGHESDFIIANAYHYRDYLIHAFNADLPYDQFVREQIAGDLLPDPRLDRTTGANESILGTGWAFLGEEVHSPVDIRQDECERTDNKVDVLGKAFLGLTVGCARCHDHKFDAISTQDYYALSGFILSSSFRQAPFESMETNRKVACELAAARNDSRGRVVAALAAAWQPGIARVADYLTAAREVFSTGTSDKRDGQIATVAATHSLSADRLGRWLACLTAAGKDERDPLHQVAVVAMVPAGDESKALTTFATPPPAAPFLTLPPGGRVVVDYSRPEFQAWKADGPAFGSRPVATGEICLDGGPDAPVAQVMTFGAARRDPFWNKLKTAPGNENDSGELGATARAGRMLATPTFTLGSGRLHYLIRGKTRVYAAVSSHLMIAGPLHGQLVRSLGSTGDAPGWVTHDLTRYAGQRVHLEFGPEGDSPLEVLMIVEANDPPAWLPGAPPWSPDAPVRSFGELARAQQAALAAAGERFGRDAIAGTGDAARQGALANWLVRHADLVAATNRLDPDGATGAFFAKVAELDRRARWESQTAVAWFDGTGVDENILVRGKATRTAALAPRSLPAAFPGAKPIQTAGSSGRYELACQVTAPENPLVARVMVNRVWHHLFGRGIVATVDNFGFLGERPTHQELLDHLAWQFTHEDHWSLKTLIKRLTLSSTFAMSSKPTDVRAEELDGANLLLHRMPVRRLEGEVIRDSLLAVSGRLDPRVGGPPVPVHLNDFIIGRGRPDQSGPLDGAGRRSIYTGMRRNFLPTFLLAFDLPTPFTTMGRRNVTNVPGQSLALMNDPLVHEEAGVWAARLLKELPDGAPEARIRWLFETAFARPPSTDEMDACRGTLAEFKALEPTGDTARESWTDLCHALFCANDFIYLK